MKRPITRDSGLEVGFSYEFGELKSGDRFTINDGPEMEKISGNCADDLTTSKCVDLSRLYKYPLKVKLVELG